MKKITIIVLAVVIVTAIALLWTHPEQPSDLQIQRKLAGTWCLTWTNMGRSLTTTNIIAPDGKFVTEISGFPDGKTIRNEGMFIVRNGVVIGTGTIDGQIITLQRHIIRLDDHELIWSDNGVAKPAFHKIK